MDAVEEGKCQLGIDLLNAAKGFDDHVVKQMNYYQDQHKIWNYRDHSCHIYEGHFKPTPLALVRHDPSKFNPPLVVKEEEEPIHDDKLKEERIKADA